MTVTYVHSNYERIPGDDYQTIDPRCIRALLDTWNVYGPFVDCCAPNGSGLVDELQTLGYDSKCAASVEFVGRPSWIITNPPYLRGVVDEIASGAVARVRDRRDFGAAFLMRANWDFAACRAWMFEDPLYRGQTRMRFRPWWSTERKAQPIHNYVWHVWAIGQGEPVIRYWPKP